MNIYAGKLLYDFPFFGIYMDLLKPIDPPNIPKQSV